MFTSVFPYFKSDTQTYLQIWSQNDVLRLQFLRNNEKKVTVEIPICKSTNHIAHHQENLHNATKTIFTGLVK